MPLYVLSLDLLYEAELKFTAEVVSQLETWTCTHRHDLRNDINQAERNGGSTTT